MLSQALLSPHVFFIVCFNVGVLWFYFFILSMHFLIFFFSLNGTRNHFQQNLSTIFGIQEICYCFASVIWRHGFTFCGPPLTFQSSGLFINTNSVSNVFFYLLVWVGCYWMLLSRSVWGSFEIFHCNKSCESTLYFFDALLLFDNVGGEILMLLLYWSWDKYLYTALYGFIAPSLPFMCTGDCGFSYRLKCMHVS